MRSSSEIDLIACQRAAAVRVWTADAAARMLLLLALFDSHLRGMTQSVPAGLKSARILPKNRAAVRDAVDLHAACRSCDAAKQGTLRRSA